MRRALFLAERGRGQTTPNPMVGALIVSPDGVIVGRGHHARAGEPHAEIHALRDAGDRARGATLYCTLEPCCHTGRTGPCSVAVADAGVRCVVAAVADPNPLVAGGGFRYLRERGVEVITGVRQHDAARLNDVFFTNVRQQRPYVTIKIAVSHDGGIAAAAGVRTAITSQAANRHAQRYRAEVDAIAIGSETLLVDDPVLTVRDLYRRRPLTRIIFDSRLRTPPAARVLTTLDAGPVIVVSTAASVAAHADRVRTLEQAGARVLTVSALPPAEQTEPMAATARAAHSTAIGSRSSSQSDAASASGTLDVRAALGVLYRDAGVCSLLLEGGAAMHAAAWNAGVVDRVRIYVGPDPLGPSCVPWQMPASFDLPSLQEAHEQWLGRDRFLEGYVYRVD
jgi:diaminohydroxyphosphoribosylaminopyrimidine deaminase/5-amino-6-(5-phosphoribosylamino)uracil reductase